MGLEITPGRVTSSAFAPAGRSALQLILPETEQGTQGSHTGDDSRPRLHKRRSGYE